MKPRCPFCQHVMRYTFSSGHKIFKCECRHCTINPYSRFQLSYDPFGELYGITIILTHDDTDYALSVRYDMDQTFLEKLKETKMSIETDSHLYHLPVTMFDLNSAIKIDLGDPVTSGLKVLNRLLKLRAFD